MFLTTLVSSVPFSETAKPRIDWHYFRIIQEGEKKHEKKQKTCGGLFLYILETEGVYTSQSVDTFLRDVGVVIINQKHVTEEALPGGQEIGILEPGRGSLGEPA